MSQGEVAPGRVVLHLDGADLEHFLQGLITNDARKLADGPIWAALLTPQGKYLVDFLLVPASSGVWLDVAEPMAADLERRLALYRLRAAVTITRTDLTVVRGLGDAPAGAVADPRHPALGWRAYGVAGGEASIKWDAIRVEHCIPETGIELIPNDTYILEAGFERLNGVDFRKGCYVGQEVTARMKHKTELRKGLVTVEIDGTAPVGTPILAGARQIGTLFTQSGTRAIAHLRADRPDGPLTAAEATIRA